MHIDEYIDRASSRSASPKAWYRRAVQLRPLDLYVHTRAATLENFWDETTTKCRGLIVHRETGEIVARPFEKFFNVDTSWRPETCVSNLPLTKPVISEKLDGSMGTLYKWRVPSPSVYDPSGESEDTEQLAIATKGSFHSDQAKWATEWYHNHLQGAEWPEGYTVMFEIIAESVQHHVVHYNGIEELVLIALIKNETGEELNPESLKLWGRRNGVRVTDLYDRKVWEMSSTRIARTPRATCYRGRVPGSPRSRSR